MRHFVHSRESRLPLTLHSFQFLVCGFIFCFYLLQLNGSCSVPFHQIFITLAVLLQFGQADFYFRNGSIVNGCGGLRSLQGGSNDGGACLCILQGGFGFHNADFIFTVVQYKQGVSLANFLVFGKINLPDITRGTQVDRRYILFYLGIVAGFGLLVIQEETDHLYDSPNHDTYSQQADYDLPTA